MKEFSFLWIMVASESIIFTQIRKHKKMLQLLHRYYVESKERGYKKSTHYNTCSTVKLILEVASEEKMTTEKLNTCTTCRVV
jgi:hypothetical protein